MNVFYKYYNVENSKIGELKKSYKEIVLYS